MKKIALTIVAAALAFSSCQIVTSNRAEMADAEAKGVDSSRIARISENMTHEYKSANYPNWYNNTSLDVVAVTGGYDFDTPSSYDEPMYSVTDLGAIYVSSASGRWYRIYGMSDAKDITSNGDDVYAVNGSGNIFKLNTSSNTFDYFTQIVNKDVKKLDVDSNGDIWVITDDSCVYKLVGTTATLIFTPTFAYGNAIPQDVGCASGNVYIASAMYGIGSGKLYKYDAATGLLVDQSVNAHKVDVERSGTIYVIDQWGALSKKYPFSATLYPESNLNQIISDIGAN